MRSRSFLRTLAISTITITLVGCGTNKEEFGPKRRCATTASDLGLIDGGTAVAGTANRGLLLATTEDYKSSRLFFFDFATGKKTQLMSGESGDPGLFASSGEFFFFNRTADSSNLRTININKSTFDLGVQTAIPGAGAGDPQAIIHLDDRYMLMSFWATSSLGVFDLEECELKEKVELAFDTGPEGGNPFRPSSLFSATTNGAKEIYVVHQGIKTDSFSLNGTQQIFILNWNGSELTATDLDPAKDKIQGIPLQVSNPTGAYAASTGTAIIAGSCTLFNDATCKSGFETVDLAARTTTLTYDTTALPEKNNGTMVAIDEKSFFAQLVIPDASSDLSKSEKIVARIDTAAKSITKVHTYPADSAGCCGLFYDQSGKNLIITDHTPTAGGSLVIMNEAGTLSEKVALENTPYTGIIIP